MKTFKKILGIALDVLIILIFLVSLVVIIFNSNKKEGGYSEIFGKTFFTVASDSMEPTFNEGDIIICDVFDKENTVLNVGDVISFYDVKKVDGVNQTIINTHRIVEINGVEIITKGDHEKFRDTIVRNRVEIIAVWHGGRLPALGAILDFLKNPLWFILILVIPILLIIGIQAYKLIKWYVANKQEQMRQKIALEGSTDEMKEAIIREYLAKQAAENQKNSEQESKKPDKE